MTFLAQTALSQNSRSFGIASNEDVSVCIDEKGKARVFGDFPNHQEFAYFAQANYQTSFLPETCVANLPLTCDRNAEAIKTYKLTGTQNGANFFELSDWQTGSGGSWENWKVINGVFSSAAGTPNTCAFLSISDFENEKIKIFSIPFQDSIKLNGSEKAKISIFDANGKLMLENYFKNEAKIATETFSVGIYLIKITNSRKTTTKKIIKI